MGMEELTDRVTRSQVNKRSKDLHGKNILNKKRKIIQESEYDSDESEYSIYSEDALDQNDQLLNDEEKFENCQKKITKNAYLNKLEKEITIAENNYNKKNNDVIEKTSIELSNNIIRSIISDIRREYEKDTKF